MKGRVLFLKNGTPANPPEGSCGLGLPSGMLARGDHGCIPGGMNEDGV
ncbi:MAG: hypothetical protein QOH59_3062 [Gemmatimonadales bacterium]|jgi:hypothetical protein|nr:hypothetical protein [Gemmatimonadales bacterium]